MILENSAVNFSWKTFPGASEFVIVPNPNNGNFKLQLNGYSGWVYIEIIDISGKINYTGQVNVADPLNLSLEKGVYMVRVLVENEYLLQKLIVY